MRALIVEQGFSRGALAAVRALTDAGWTVGVGSPKAGLASSSRFCARRHVVPAAHEDPQAFLTGVVRAVESGAYDVVFGAGEAEVLALSEHRRLIPATVPHSPHATVRRALDKTVLHEAAEAVGLAVPVAVDPVGLTDDSAHDDSVQYIVKAAMHAQPGRKGAPPRLDTLAVTGGGAALRRADQIRQLGGEPHIQRLHPGRLTAYSAVSSPNGAAVVADSMQVASRIWPPMAGASCRARTVPVDPQLAERCAHLLKRLGWFGLAELQFVQSEDGQHRVIDLNGRYYGSLALAVRAGANLPATWAALAMGRDVRPVRARAGVRYQWLHGDLRRAAATGWPRKGHDIAGTLAAAASSVHSVGRLRDPAPAAHLVRGMIGRARAGTG